MSASAALSTVQVTGSNLNITYVVLAVALGALAIKLERPVAEVTDAQVSEALDRIAEQNRPFAARGEGGTVEKGDRVVIYMSMSVEGVTAMQACARIGATRRELRLLGDDRAVDVQRSEAGVGNERDDGPQQLRHPLRAAVPQTGPRPDERRLDALLAACSGAKDAAKPAMPRPVMSVARFMWKSCPVYILAATCGTPAGLAQCAVVHRKFAVRNFRPTVHFHTDGEGLSGVEPQGVPALAS